MLSHGVSSILQESSVPSHSLPGFFWHLEELFAPSGLTGLSGVSCALSWRQSTDLLGVCAGQRVGSVLELCFSLSSSPFSTECHQVAPMAYLHSISGSAISCVLSLLCFHIATWAILSLPTHFFFFFHFPRGNSFQAAGLYLHISLEWDRWHFWIECVCHHRDGGQLLVILQLKLDYMIFYIQSNFYCWKIVDIFCLQCQHLNNLDIICWYGIKTLNVDNIFYSLLLILK